MKAFEIKKLTIWDGGLRLQVDVEGDSLEATKFGVGAWETMSRDALHEILTKIRPGLKKANMPRGRNRGQQAWSAVVTYYEQQAAKAKARDKKKIARGNK